MWGGGVRERMSISGSEGDRTTNTNTASKNPVVLIHAVAHTGHREEMVLQSFPNCYMTSPCGDLSVNNFLYQKRSDKLHTQQVPEGRVCAYVTGRRALLILSGSGFNNFKELSAKCFSASV